jgi:hypothetical protein
VVFTLKSFAFFIWFSSAFLACAHAAGIEEVSENDELSSLLMLYDEAVSDFQSLSSAEQDAVRDAFWREWLLRFQQSVAANPESKYRVAAITKAIGISNSLGEFTVSYELSSEVARNATTDDERVFWLIEAAETARAAFVATNDNRSEDNAFKAYTEAISIYDLKNQLQPECLRRIVIASASVVTMATRSDDRFIASGSLAKRFLERAATIVASLDAAAYESLRRDGFGQEQIILSEIKISFAEGAHESTLEHFGNLRELSGHESIRSAPSLELLQYASAAWPSGGSEYCRFLDKWLSREGADIWSDLVEWNYIIGCATIDDCNNALERGKALESRLSITPKRADSNDSPGPLKREHLIELYHALSKCALTNKQIDAATEYIEKWKALMPEDVRLPSITGELLENTSKSERNLNAGSFGAGKLKIVFVVVNGIIALGAFALWSSKQKSK